MALRQVTFDEKDLKKIFRLDTPLGRFWRVFKRVLQSVFYFAVLFGVFFLGINYSAFFKRASFSAKAVPVVTVPPLATPVVPVVTYAPEIIIPKLGLEAPVIYDAGYADILDRLRTGVVRYQGTADPGQIGNVVILGHSSDYPWSTGQYKTVFALLDHLAIGDEIILPFETNRYTYTVSAKKVVKASNLTVLGRTSTPELTLVTCYPVGTAINRLVIVADLTSGPVGTTQATDPFLGSKLVTAR